MLLILQVDFIVDFFRLRFFMLKIKKFCNDVDEYIQPFKYRKPLPEFLCMLHVAGWFLSANAHRIKSYGLRHDVLHHSRETLITFVGYLNIFQASQL